MESKHIKSILISTSNALKEYKFCNNSRSKKHLFKFREMIAAATIHVTNSHIIYVYECSNG